MKSKYCSRVFKCIFFLLLFAFFLFLVCFLFPELFPENRYSLDWWYKKTAWQSLIDNEEKEVIVAVIDTGVNIEHEALSGKIWVNEHEVLNGIDDDGNGYVDDIYGWNFVNENNEVAETEISHGTAVSGLIVGDGKMAGVASFAPIKVMVLKVLDDNGESYNSTNLDRAIEYAENNGATICNCSFGMEEYSNELFDVIKKSNMLFITSAGNSSQGRSLNRMEYYPAKYNLPNIIVVSACEENGIPWIHANYGSEVVDLYAKGVEMYTCSIDGYNYFSGVSLSIPMVTGVAAIIESYGCSSDFGNIKNILLEYFSLSNSKLIPYCKNGKQLIS